MKNRAVFLDRDGTIIEDCGYVREPAQVRLLPGAADAIRRLAKAGHRIVIVSNQSGVARGLFDESTMRAVHQRVKDLLDAEGVPLDGAYYCPYLSGSEAIVESYRRDSDLRKPRPGMLLQAARELDIDLARSWMIGDSPCDVNAGRSAGCQTVLLGATDTADDDGPAGQTLYAKNLSEAADLVECAMKEERDIPSDLGKGDDQEQHIRLLSEIRDLLDQSRRQDRQQDFSLMRLFGALLQMFAIVAAIWSATSILDDQHAAATARLALAGFLQLASLSAFVLARFR